MARWPDVHCTRSYSLFAYAVPINLYPIPFGTETRDQFTFNSANSAFLPPICVLHFPRSHFAYVSAAAAAEGR